MTEYEHDPQRDRDYSWYQTAFKKKQFQIPTQPVSPIQGDQGQISKQPVYPIQGVDQEGYRYLQPVGSPTQLQQPQPGYVSGQPVTSQPQSSGYVGIETGPEFFPDGTRNPMYLPQQPQQVVDQPVSGQPVAAQPQAPAPLPTQPPQNYYLSDIGFLRGMPEGLVEAYQKYIRQSQLDPTSAGKTQEEIARLWADPALQQQYQQDIGYLRGTPGEGMDQAFLTTARENIENRYRASIGNIMRQASMRGIEPSSGPIQDQIRQLEEAKDREMADAERQLAMWKINEQRSRLAESRGVSSELEGILTGRRGRALGLGEALDNMLLGRRGLEKGIFQELDALEQQRRAQSRGVEQSLDQQERQRLMDVLGFIQGAQPSSTPATLTSQWAATTGQQSAEAGQGFAGGLAGLGQSGLYYALLSNPELMKAFLGTPTP